MLVSVIMSQMLLAIIAVLAAAASELAPSALPGMPWLHGLYGAAVTELPDDTVAPRMTMWVESDAECPAGFYPGMAIEADVAPSPGNETVLASYTQGVLVLDSEGELLASSPGYTCEGTADDAIALAAGSTFLEPTIALVVTSGGRREQITWLALYRVGFGGRLDPVFTASVEEREDEVVRRGDVAFVPGGLLYRRPGGGWSVWIYDPVGRAYMHRGELERSDEPPHVPPMFAEGL